MRTGHSIKLQTPCAISFSGGRTSAYMLRLMLDSYGGTLPSDCKVIFSNTGKEMEETLAFVHECGERWRVPIVWLEYRAPKDFEVVTFETASRNGEPFEAIIDQRQYLPNPVARFCTAELKICTMHKYLRSLGWESWANYLGIRADEPRRLAKLTRSSETKDEDRCAPLGPLGVTAADVGEFWENNDFDLRLPNIGGKTSHGNCDLCFLKGPNQIKSLIAQEPTRAEWWARMEEKKIGVKSPAAAYFRSDRPSYRQMQRNALEQQDMFGIEAEEGIECFCGD